MATDQSSKFDPGSSSGTAHAESTPPSIPGDEVSALSGNPPGERLAADSNDQAEPGSSFNAETYGTSNRANTTSTPNRNARNLLIAGVLFAIVAAIALFFFSKSVTRDTGPKLTHEITRDNLVVSVIEQGTLESSNNTEIKCRIRGSSTVIWVVEGGTEVQPGDELVRLDTKRIEESIGKHTTDAHVAKATFERTKADVARAEIAIDAYLEGTYKSELKALEKQLALSLANLENAEKVLAHSEAMFRKGYVSKYELESNRFRVKEAELDLKVRQTAINVLNKYTKEMELETLRGDLRSLQSKFKADKAGLALDEGRRDRAIEELGYCVIKADRSGLVIYPSAAAWKDTPDIAEGANVRNDQVLLLMPDLSQMQVKVGIHEALIDRIKKGLTAKITLPDLAVEGKVTTVASVAKPAGWWTGNVVKYDTTIELPSMPGLKPGMSAEVEIILSEHRDVITIPVSAVVELGKQKVCWVKTESGVERRLLKLGASNDVFVIAKSGVAEGDRVVLNPLRYVEEARGQALQTLDVMDSDIQRLVPHDDSATAKTSSERSPAEDPHGP